MSSKGILTVVSGPSGCGKGTVLKYVMQDKSFCFSVSATTRLPRAGEEHGVNYFFITKEEFFHRIDNNMLLEYAEYCGNYYGTPLDYVNTQLENGKNVVLEIETEGAFKVKELVPDAFLLFVAPPDMQTLEDRLRGRGTEDEATIQKRLARAKEEMELMPRYDMCVINKEGAAEATAHEIIAAVNARRKA